MTKPNQVAIDPAGARNAPAEISASTSSEKADGESEQDYLKRRSEQARTEAQQRPEPANPAPVTDSPVRSRSASSASPSDR